MVYHWDFGDGDSSLLMDPEHTYTNDGDFVVTLTVNSGPPDFCTDVYTMIISVVRPSKIFIPNIVTPNDDGLNDEFKVKSEALATENMAIYNRWGRKVFEWNQVGGSWDCKKENGGDFASGTYYYIFIATGKDGVDYNRNGMFEVLK
jgi:gliding motility-associated-like protein